MGLAYASVGVFLVMPLSILILGFAGYAQRVLVAVLFTWTIVVARQLNRTPSVATTA